MLAVFRTLSLIIWSLMAVSSCGPPPVDGSSANKPPIPAQSQPQQDTVPKGPPTPDLPTPKSSWQEFLVPTDTLEKAFSDKAKYSVSAAEIRKRFALTAKFGGGKSGSYVFDVYLKEQPQQKRVFKTLQKIVPQENLWDHIGFKEIFFSQRLSQLKPSSLLPASKNASMFFPKFYGFGLCHSPDPFTMNDGQSQDYYPFYVMERIEGISFQDFITKPAEAKKILGYDFASLKPGALFSILFQITIALYEAHEQFQFIHLDDHPGNIMISKTPIDGLEVNAFDAKTRLVGPLVKIIDFDQGSVPGHEPTAWRKTKNFTRMTTGNVGKEREFFKYLNPKASDFDFLDLVRISNQHSPNIDIYMLNVLLHTFRKRLWQEGKLDVRGKYYDSLADFILFFADNAHKFGLKVP